MPRLPGVIAFAAIAAITVVPAHAGMVDNIIFGKCSSAMRKEYEKAGQTTALESFECHLQLRREGDEKQKKR